MNEPESVNESNTPAATESASADEQQTPSLDPAAEGATASAGSSSPQQGEMPFAIVQGKAVTALPQDLYIPPDALEVFLEAFEGPLDLLLYLIKRQNLDVLDIPIAAITHQYMEYVEMMKELQLELAAEYLVMAAMLAEIKSRMLLPRPVEEENEEDPRAELVRRLQEYERIKQAAEDLDTLPRLHRDVFPVSVKPPELKLVKPLPEVELKDLMMAFKDVLVRADMYTHHHVQMEPLSVRERMTIVLSKVQADSQFVSFSDLFTYEEGRKGVVVTFLAILELIKESLIELVQTAPYEPIHIKVAGA
jgi:segregation and condensation protein A